MNSIKSVVHRSNGRGGVMCQSKKMDPALTEAPAEVTCKMCQVKAQKRMHPEAKARLNRRGGITAAKNATFNKFERR